MAETITMKHAGTEKIKQGFLGYSWTMLFFQWAAPLIRGDFKTAAILLAAQIAIVFNMPPLIALLCFAYPSFIWSFFWNKNYTNKLIQEGYIFNESDAKNQYAQVKLTQSDNTTKILLTIYCLITLPPVLIFQASIANIADNISGRTHAEPAPINKKAVTDDDLSGIMPSNISPYGELAQIFKIGSDYTDLQRENKIKEIKGEVVAWSLPVYDIKSSGKYYEVITESKSNTVSCLVMISAQTESDKRIIETIKTGDIMHFKGIIWGVGALRHIEIQPAILMNSSASSRQTTQIEDPQQSSTNNVQYQRVAGYFDCGLGEYSTCSMGNVTFPGRGIISDRIFSECSYRDFCVVDVTIDNNHNIEEVASVTSMMRFDGEKHTKTIKFNGCKIVEGGLAIIQIGDNSVHNEDFSINYGLYKQICPKLQKESKYKLTYSGVKTENEDGYVFYMINFAEFTKI